MITADKVQEAGEEAYRFLCDQGFGDLLAKIRNPHLVGGALIDGVFNRPVNDYDIVYDLVDNINNVEGLYEGGEFNLFAFGEYEDLGEHTTNYFGGDRITTSAGIQVDLFSVNDMPPAVAVTVRGRPLAEVYAELVPLNIDQISYNINTRVTYCQGYAEAFSSGVVRVTSNLLEYWPEGLILKRAASKAERYGLEFKGLLYEYT